MPHDEDFHVEPVRGLPERPPEGEHVLWQGAPQPWALAKIALNAHWIAGYFLALAIWRGVAVGAEAGPAEGLIAASWFAAIGAVAVGVLALMACPWTVRVRFCPSKYPKSVEKTVFSSRSVSNAA